jgi:hypothetical protein
MSKDITIGYWKSHLHEDLPIPLPDTACADQAEVIAKLKALMSGGYWQQYRGWSNCRLCGKQNGSKELEIIRGDTKYRIPEGYVHYLEDHRVGYDLRLLELL